MLGFESITYKKTLLVDCDGTILKHQGNLDKMLEVAEPIFGVPECLKSLRATGWYIVITTARPEWSRYKTMEQLDRNGIVYDQLVMGLPTGKRVVLNDAKPDIPVMAEAHTLVRDKGFAHLDFT